jgi:hypothetical protein
MGKLFTISYSSASPCHWRCLHNNLFFPDGQRANHEQGKPLIFGGIQTNKRTKACYEGSDLTLTQITRVALNSTRRIFCSKFIKQLINHNSPVHPNASFRNPSWFLFSCSGTYVKRGKRGVEKACTGVEKIICLLDNY